MSAADLELPPLALYVHLPWCVRKCPYCDFNSHKAGAAPPFSSYVDALLADLRSEARHAAGRPLVSLFLGGGTPSLFPAQEIERLLVAVRAEFDVVDAVEITMEANPGTIEHGALAGYAAAGVNRLSIGAQSFSAAALTRLGRIHTVADIGRTVAEARDAGFANLNIDLMYALPGQDAAAAQRDLEQAVALQPDHISWYQLTLEPNTVFFAKPPGDLPDDDHIAVIQHEGERFLANSGYEQYEISAYARGAQRCRHNLNYWTFGDYMGIGAGAHGKRTAGGEILRTVKPANPQMYIEAMLAGSQPAPTSIAPPDRVFEFMLNALRLTDGFAEDAFVARTGIPAADIRPRLESLLEKQLLEEFEAGQWRPSERGRRFLNDVQAAFLP